MVLLDLNRSTVTLVHGTFTDTNPTLIASTTRDRVMVGTVSAATANATVQIGGTSAITVQAGATVTIPETLIPAGSAVALDTLPTGTGTYCLSVVLLT